MGEEERYKRAKERVEELKGFYEHLTIWSCPPFIDLKEKM
uniref:Uncharacterized protein n=1 Tax=Candidatus Methanophagaceae archaeon ANME-1 ERB6 TaxID=2759912 RepID=A0A7G9Z179_9EURY|nr:hypothetical protein OHMBFCMF_00032 [Methanosarcinales archaeon ANME-1 ERB6]